MKNSGVYKITNLKTGQYYIGSSYDITKRIKRHKRELKKGNHHSIYLQRSYDKYGVKLFKYEVIFNCKREFNIEYEQYFLDKLKPEFNVSKNALAPMDGLKHTKETKRKMSKAHKRNKYALGRKQSQEERERRGNIRRGTKHTKKTKKQMSETAKRINSISRINRNNTRKKVRDSLGNIFKSLTDAAKYHNISKPTVCDILKGRHYKTRSGVSFEYI